MNTKKEVKEVCSIRLSKFQKIEILKFWKWNLTEWVWFILEFILWKNENVIHNDSKRNTIIDKNVIQNQKVQMNDKMQQFLSKPKIEEKRQPTASQKFKISEINKLTNNWTKPHREDGEEYTQQELMTRAGLSDFS